MSDTTITDSGPINDPTAQIGDPVTPSPDGYSPPNGDYSTNNDQGVNDAYTPDTSQAAAYDNAGDNSFGTSDDNQRKSYGDPTAQVGEPASPDGYSPPQASAPAPATSDPTASIGEPAQPTSTGGQAVDNPDVGADPTASVGQPAAQGAPDSGASDHANIGERSASLETPEYSVGESKQITDAQSGVYNAQNDATAKIGEQVRGEYHTEGGSLQGEWADLDRRWQEYVDAVNSGEQDRDPTFEASIQGEGRDLQARWDAYQNRDTTAFYADRFTPGAINSDSGVQQAIGNLASVNGGIQQNQQMSNAAMANGLIGPEQVNPTLTPQQGGAIGAALLPDLPGLAPTAAANRTVTDADVQQAFTDKYGYAYDPNNPRNPADYQNYSQIYGNLQQQNIAARNQQFTDEPMTRAQAIARGLVVGDAALAIGASGALLGPTFSTGAILATYLDQGLPAQVPGTKVPIPDVLQHPKGALLDNPSGPLSADVNAVRTFFAQGPGAAGSQVFNDIKNGFEQDPVTYARQQGLQQENILTLAAGTVSLHSDNSVLNAIHLADPIQNYQDAFSRLISQGVAPADAAEQAFATIDNKVTDILWQFAPFNPMYKAVDFPVLGDAVSNLFTSKTSGAIEDLAARGAFDAKTAELAKGILDARAANPVSRLTDLWVGNAATRLSDMMASYIPTLEDTSMYRDMGARYYRGVEALANGDTLGAQAIANEITNRFGGTLQSNYSLIEQMELGVAKDIVDRGGGDLRTVANMAGAKAGNLEAGEYTQRQLMENARRLNVDLPTGTNLTDTQAGQLAAVQGLSVRNALTSDIRAGWFAHAGIDLPGTANALKQGMDGLFGLVRGLLLFSSAPPLAIQKFFDEYSRGALKDVIGIRPADTALAQAGARFVEKNNVFGQGERAANFLSSGTVQRGLQEGMYLPDSLLRPAQSPYGVVNAFTGTNRYGEAMALGDRLKALGGAPGRAIDKWNQSLISAPTQHVLLNAAYQEISGFGNAKEAIARDVMNAILQRTGDHVAATTAYDALVNARGQDAFLQQAAKLDGMYASLGARDAAATVSGARAPSAAGLSRFSASAPSSRVMQDINRTGGPPGLVRDYATPGTVRGGVPQNVEEFRAWRDAVDRAKTAKGAPLTPQEQNVIARQLAQPQERTPGRIDFTGGAPTNGTEIAPTGARIAGVDGNTTAVRFENGEQHPAQYRVVSLDDLKINSDVQPRDRAGSVISSEQVRRMGRDFDPARLLNDASGTSESTPIALADGRVLSGNGRLSVLTDVRNAQDARWSAYQERLRQDASRYGIDPSALDGVKDPVLVRENRSAVGESDPIRYAEQANATGTLARGSTEQAANDVALLNGRVMATFAPAADESLSAAVRSNDESVRRFVQELARTDPNGAASLVDPRTTALRNSAYERFEDALVARAYGEYGPGIATRVLEQADPQFISIGNAIKDAAPQLAAAAERNPASSIGAEVRWVLDVLPAVKAAGGAENYLGNRTLDVVAAANAPRTPAAENLLRFLWENRANKTALTDGLRRYAALAAPAQGAANALLPDAVRALGKDEALRSIAGSGGSRGLDMAAGGGGGMGYLSAQQRAIRDNPLAAGFGGIPGGTTRNLRPGVNGDIIRGYAKDARGTMPYNIQAQVEGFRQDAQRAIASGDRTAIDRIEQRMLDHGQAAQVARNPEAYQALHDARVDLFGEATTSPEARAARDAQLIEQARPLTAQERLDQVFGGRRISPEAPRTLTPESNARFGQAAQESLNAPTDEELRAASVARARISDPTAQIGEPLRLGEGERPLQLGAGSDVRPFAREGFASTPPRGTDFTVGAQGLVTPGQLLEPPRDTLAIANAYRGLGGQVREAGQRFAETQRQTLQDALQRGYNIVGNPSDQTLLGHVLQNGAGPIPPVLPFAPFHIHSSQFWAQYFAAHPQMAIGFAQAIDNLDDYGTLHLPNGQTVSGLLKLTTGAHLVDWAMKAVGYAQAVNAQGNNNLFQQVGKNLAYNTVGNNGFVRPFPYITDPAQAFVQQHTNPLLSGKTAYDAQGRPYPGIDPRDAYKESGTMAGLTGAGQLANDALGQPLPRNVVGGITNPGQALGNAAVRGLSRATGSNLKLASDDTALAYFAGQYAQQHGFDPKDVQQSLYNPTNANQAAFGQQIRSAFQQEQDSKGLGRIAPVQIGQDDTAKGIFPPTAFNDNAQSFFDARDFAGEGGKDAGVRVPTASGGYRLETPDRAQYNTARNQLELPPSLSSAPTADYARDYLQRTGYQPTSRSILSPDNAGTSARFDQSQRALTNQIAGNASRFGAGLPQDQRTALLGAVGTELAPNFTTNDLINQPGNVRDLIRQYEQAKAGGASKEQLRAISDRINDAQAKDLAQFPATKSYFDFENAQRGYTPGEPSGYATWDQSKKDAWDAFNNLRSSPDYKRYQELQEQQAAAGPFGSPGEKAWYASNRSELTRLQGVITGAEQSIVDRYGINPRQLANDVAVAAGRNPTYATTEIKAPSSTSSTTSAPRASSPSSTRTRSATYRSGTSSSTGSRTTSGAGSYAANQQAGDDFYNFYSGLTSKADKATVLDALDRAGVNPLGQKGVSAQTFERALSVAQDALTSRSRSVAAGAATGLPGTSRYEPVFYQPTARDAMLQQQGVYVSPELAQFMRGGGGVSTLPGMSAAGVSRNASLPGASASGGGSSASNSGRGNVVSITGRLPGASAFGQNTKRKA